MIEECPFKDTILEMNSRMGNIEGKLDRLISSVESDIKRMDDHIKDGENYRKQVETNTAFRKVGIWVSGGIGAAVGYIAGAGIKGFVKFWSKL